MNFDSFLNRPEFSQWQSLFETAIATRTSPARHGDLPKWLDIISQLPNAKPSCIELNQDAITIGREEDLTTIESEQLTKCLEALIPWRKGPFNLFGVHIDTEWHSEWKWNRLLPHISNLTGSKILDVGCGNGYHCWRMLGEAAEYVMGIDPSMRFAVQHKAIQHYTNNANFDLLPLGIEDMPTDMPIFDSVFSMGVLYHRRNPINHLNELKGLLQNGGELVLETMIIDEIHCGQYEEINDGVLTPKQRYAQMRNVWSIMSVNKILQLLEQAGFSNVRCVDQNVTTVEEQRSTHWMNFHSLANYLDPNDSKKTIEGYPAPKRAIFIANK